MEKQFESPIKIIQSDWGGEYRSFAKFLENEGILFRQSCPPHICAKRTCRDETSPNCRSWFNITSQAAMPLHYWWEAFQSAVYIINMLPSTVLNNQSPFLTLFNKSPDYSLMKAFGCACYPNLRSYNEHKFAFHTTKCVFLGVSGQHKGYRCLSSTGRLYVSRHVVFNEADFPFQSGFLNTKRDEQRVSSTLPLSIDHLLTW